MEAGWEPNGLRLYNAHSATSYKRVVSLHSRQQQPTRSLTGERFKMLSSNRCTCQKALFVFSFLAIPCLAGGCSRPTIQGEVTRGGEPIAAGQIIFRSLDDASQPKLSGAIRAGRFEVDQAADAGEYQVTIVVHFATSSEAQAFYEEPSDSTNRRDTSQANPRERYDFKRTLKSGSNHLQLELLDQDKFAEGTQ